MSQRSFTWLHGDSTLNGLTQLEEWSILLHRYMQGDRVRPPVGYIIASVIDFSPLPSEREKYEEALALSVYISQQLGLDQHTPRAYQKLTRRQLRKSEKASNHHSVQKHIWRYVTPLPKPPSILGVIKARVSAFTPRKREVA